MVFLKGKSAINEFISILVAYFSYMKLIDTHCHLYLDEYRYDIEAIMERADEAGVRKFYFPAIDSREIKNQLALEERYPESCRAMVGLHPCSVKADYQAELEIVSGWLGRRKYAALGEIGLDFYWDRTFVNEQYVSFRLQIEWAFQYDLPIVIHTRNAMQETIDVVREFVPKGISGIFHCFNGTYENAKDIIDAGFYLGIGGVLTYKNSGLTEVIEKIGLEYLVLETDSPYLTPLPFRGKRNESSYLKYIVEKLALIKNVDVEEVATMTSANAEKIFRI